MKDRICARVRKIIIPVGVRGVRDSADFWTGSQTGWMRHTFFQRKGGGLYLILHWKLDSKLCEGRDPVCSLPCCISSLWQGAWHTADAMLDTEMNSQRGLWPREDGDSQERDSGGKEAKSWETRKETHGEKGASLWRSGIDQEGTARRQC